MKVSEEVRHHFKYPVNSGEFLVTDGVVSADVVSADESKAIRLQIRLVGQILKVGYIEDTRFMAQGCPYTMAVGSYLAELLINKKLAELEEIKAADIAAALDLPASRHYSALLGEEAIKALLRALN